METESGKGAPASTKCLGGWWRDGGDGWPAPAVGDRSISLRGGRRGTRSGDRLPAAAAGVDGRDPLPVIRSFLVLLLLGGFVPALATGRTAAATAREGRATEETPLRAEPEDGAEALILIPAETSLEIEGRAEGGYYPVSYGGVAGWAATGSLATRADERAEPGVRVAAAQEGDGAGTGGPPTSGGGRAAATVEDLNLREAPSAEGEVLVVIPAGEEVRLTGEVEEDFLGVGYDGFEGWASGEYLRAVEPEEPAEPTDEAPGEYREAEIVGFILDAADYYDQPREDMLRVARCESELTPTAVNQRTGDYGLFQFKPGTWRSTPYGEYDIFDPRASAYAAGWMWSVGRRNEWVCQ